MIKNPNGKEVNQLVIYKRGRGIELGTTENKSSERPGWDFNSGPPDNKATLPPVII